MLVLTGSHTAPPHDVMKVPPLETGEEKNPGEQDLVSSQLSLLSFRHHPECLKQAVPTSSVSLQNP